LEKNIVGICENLKEMFAIKLIFSDGDRTIGEAKKGSASKWVDKMIPIKSTIKKIEIMYDRDKSLLLGIKFIDKDAKTLLSAGKIDSNLYRGKRDFPIKEFELADNERLIGIKSSLRGWKDGHHFDFSFIIGSTINENINI